MAARMLTVLLGLLIVFSLACGATAAPTVVPTTAPTAPTSVPEVVVGATVVPIATALPPEVAPTVVPTATALRPEVVSARDNMTLVVSLEPTQVNLFFTGSGQTSNSIFKENMGDPLTWPSGDDQRIIPTTGITGWEQLAPDQWRFFLRRGVKFHNGEPWNAQAALPSLQFQGQASTGTSSHPYTGSFTADVVDDYTVDITCDQGCPIFPNTSIYVHFIAPNFLATATEDQKASTTVGLGPYKLVNWDAVSITEEAYEDYVPAGDHYEFQKAHVKNITWRWRGEPTVMAAMVKADEADIAWDVGVDAIESLPKDMVRSGGTAKVWTVEMNTMWNSELKKVKVRQAMAHAINCQELVDELYGGYPKCWGNVTFPGVIGATEENTAPYTYDPPLSRQLLREANYDPNTTLTYVSRASRIPKQTEINEAIQGYLKEVGIDVEIKTVDPSIRNEYRKCQAGAAVNDLLKASGRVPGTDQPTFDDFRSVLASDGPTSCAYADLIENQPPNQTLDFGRLITSSLNCEYPYSPNCDPSPGGFQELRPKALAATGAERQRLMQEILDRVHDEAWFFMGFDLVYFYAVDPKLNWTPRFDGLVRANTMWFSP